MNTGLLEKKDETEVEVRWEDQKKINEFGRNNALMDEIREDIKKFEVSLPFLFLTVQLLISLFAKG